MLQEFRHQAPFQPITTPGSVVVLSGILPLTPLLPTFNFTKTIRRHTSRSSHSRVFLSAIVSSCPWKSFLPERQRPVWRKCDSEAIGGSSLIIKPRERNLLATNHLLYLFSRILCVSVRAKRSVCNFVTVAVRHITPRSPPFA